MDGSRGLLMALAAIMYGFHLPGHMETRGDAKFMAPVSDTLMALTCTAWHEKCTCTGGWARCCSSEELLLFARGLKGDLLFHSVVMPFLLTKVNWWQSRGEAFGGRKKSCWPFSDWIWPQSRIPAVAEMIDYCNDRQNGLLACLNGNKFHQEEGNLTTFWATRTFFVWGVNKLWFINGACITSAVQH